MNAPSLPPARVLALGAVTSLGRSQTDIARHLLEPPPASGRVADQYLVNPPLAARLRRADRFIRMAVSAALDAWNNIDSADIPHEHLGLILASGFGPHVRGFRFLDGILDCGDSAALPTDFSHSLHGAATAHIAEILNVRGPAFSVTDFENGFAQAVLLAQCWLAQGRCQRVLVGAVEESGEVLNYCAAKLLNQPSFTAGEGAVFALLGPQDSPGAIHIEHSCMNQPVDLLFTQDAPIPARPAATPLPARHHLNFTPHFGHSASSPAFQFLAACLMLQDPTLADAIIKQRTPGITPGSIDKAAIPMQSSNPPANFLYLTRDPP